MLITRNLTVVIAVALFLLGASLTALGAVTDSLPRTITGITAAISSQIAFSLCMVHRWTTNTAAGRAALHDATVRAEREHAKYLAAQFALEQETERVHVDGIAAAARVDQTLKRERAAMQQQFDDQRGELICRTAETAISLHLRGLLNTEREHGRVVVPFPSQPEHERARGREDVSP